MRAGSASCRGSPGAAERLRSRSSGRRLPAPGRAGASPRPVSSVVPARARPPAGAGHLTHPLFFFHSTHKALLFYCVSVCASACSGLPGQRGGAACRPPLPVVAVAWWQRPELPAFGPKSSFSPEGRLPPGVGGLPAPLARHLWRTTAWHGHCPACLSRAAEAKAGQLLPGIPQGVQPAEGGRVPAPCCFPESLSCPSYLPVPS